jgi:hypothetical protein
MIAIISAIIPIASAMAASQSIKARSESSTVTHAAMTK